MKRTSVGLAMLMVLAPGIVHAGLWKLEATSNREWMSDWWVVFDDSYYPSAPQGIFHISKGRESSLPSIDVENEPTHRYTWLRGAPNIPGISMLSGLSASFAATNPAWADAWALYPGTGCPTCWVDGWLSHVWSYSITPYTRPPAPPPPPPPPSVPAPGVFILIVSGILGIGAIRQRVRR